MAITGTVTQVFDSTLNESVITGTLALSGTYPTGGDTFDITALSYNGQGLDFKTIPRIKLWEEPAAGTLPSGYIFTYCPGTTQANGVVAVMNGAATQFTPGAYSSPLLAAVVRFEIESLRL